MSALSAFVRDQISLEEFERAEEQRLLREAGPLHPVPDGWAVPPPCNHEWIDITRMGDRGRSFLCARCGEHGWEL